MSSVADTQLWEERGDSGKSKAAVFADHGLFWEPADKASIQRNAERVSERLRDYDDKRPPALMIFESCKKTCEMLSSIKVDENDNLIPDKKSPLKHWFDIVAYGSARASRGAGSIVMELHEFDKPDPENDNERAPMASGFGYGS